MVNCLLNHEKYVIYSLSQTFLTLNDKIQNFIIFQLVHQPNFYYTQNTMSFNHPCHPLHEK